jgi:hypothetical protein
MPQVMPFLVQAHWIRSEAKAMGIRVGDREVRREFERQRRVAFRSQRAFRRFLRRSGFSHRMILVRVQLDLLQQKVTRKVVDAAPPGQSDAEALDEFVAEFRARHRAETFCAGDYVIRECANSPPDD